MPNFDQDFSIHEKSMIEKLKSVAFNQIKPSAKGYARLVLNNHTQFLREALRQGVTLATIRDLLAQELVIVSVASLRRFLLSELRSEYVQYLQMTGRGLKKNRTTGNPPEPFGLGKSKENDCTHDRSGLKNQISNPADIRNLITNNDLDDF